MLEGLAVAVLEEDALASCTKICMASTRRNCCFLLQCGVDIINRNCFDVAKSMHIHSLTTLMLSLLSLRRQSFSRLERVVFASLVAASLP